MSTAGKVLTVLILLVMMGWIVMLSAVAQLNANWSERVAKLERDYKAADDLVTDRRAAIADATELARTEQQGKDRDLREVQGRVVSAEGRLSLRTEDLTRSQIQLADYEAAVKKAELNLATRKTELAKATEDLAAKKVEIAQKQEDNAKLRDQLGKLQGDFKRLLGNNIKQVRASIAPDRPDARPAADRRPAPSS